MTKLAKHAKAFARATGGVAFALDGYAFYQSYKAGDRAGQASSAGAIVLTAVAFVPGFGQGAAVGAVVVGGFSYGFDHEIVKPAREAEMQSQADACFNSLAALAKMLNKNPACAKKLGECP